jgi:hypothetical protein
MSGACDMKKILGLFALCILIVSFSTVSKAAADASSWQKSVNIQPQNPSDFTSSSFDTSVNNAIADGANYITLVIPVQQSNVSSTTISAGPETPTDASLTSAVNYIHAHGASVAFVLHDDVADGTWRAFINPTDRGAWFTSYGAQLNHYANLAKGLNVQELIIGSELSDMTLPSVNSTNTANWDALIQTVRSEYSGMLTYASQHDGYMADDETLGFWPELDAIGIDAYYSLGNGGDETVATIEANWNQYEGEIQALSTRYNKPVIFTEVGYVSQTNALIDPGSSSSENYPIDDTLQANAYQALFQYWENYSFMKGVELWDWSSNPYDGGTNDNGYTPQNKPAEQIMKNFFSSNSTTVPLNPINTTYSASSTAGANPVPNSPTTITSQVSASSSTSNMIVDIEIYNSHGQQVSQNYYANQTLGTTPVTYTSSYTPTVADKYTIEIGVFTSNWQTNTYWNSAAGLAVVTAPIVPPTPTTPPSTSNPSNVDVWWPTNGNTVSGVQPFQATLDGVDPATYNMYWQVDGGTLNLMTTSLSPVAHKVAEVDLSSWNWSSNDQYTITFVAKNLAGNIIATNSENITVGQ